MDQDCAVATSSSGLLWSLDCESPFSNMMSLLPSSFHILGAHAEGVREPMCLLLSHLGEPVGLLVWVNPALYHRAPWHFPWFLLGGACTCPMGCFVFCPGYLYCLLSLFAVSSTSLIKRISHVGWKMAVCLWFVGWILILLHLCSSCGILLFPCSKCDQLYSQVEALRVPQQLHRGAILDSGTAAKMSHIKWESKTDSTLSTSLFSWRDQIGSGWVRIGLMLPSPYWTTWP